MPSSNHQNYLTCLMLEDCDVEYVFPSSIVNGLKHLQFLSIEDCDSLKEIVVKGGEEPPKLVFPQLTTLKLIGLSKLTTFYSEMHILEFPVLKTVRLENCHKLESIALTKKIAPNLEKFVLSGRSIKMIFPNQFAESHISKLKVLELNEDNESTCIPLRIVQNLETLKIQRCDKLINVVPSSKSFQKLTTLEVFDCNGLENLLTSSTAKSLKLLREMRIRRCKLMVEVVAKEKDVSKDEIVFNELKLLSLEDLESLTSFSSENYSLKFPLLDEFIVRGCLKMETFFEGNLTAPRLEKVKRYERFDKLEKVERYERSDTDEGFWEDDLNTTVQQLHKEEIAAAAAISEVLELRGKDIIMMWHNQFSENHFSQRKVLKVVYGDESTCIPLRILQSFTSLEKLDLSRSSYKEIFSCREIEKHGETTPTQIKVLDISSFSELKHMWEQDSRLELVLQNLETLKIKYCNKLINVVPSSKSFQNLTTLEVSGCKGLMNLLTTSTAKSLKRLSEMRIERCELMIEVVANVEDVSKDEIVFNELKLLLLADLKSLTSFCSRDYSIKFPLLEELIVRECPNMKTFCGRDLNSPRLEKVQQYDWSNNDEGFWEGDLNTTIQELYKENSNLGKLILIGDDIRMAWQKHNYSLLKVLEVIKDESTNISLKILQRLNNLKELVLRVCSYQEIFSCEEGEKHDGMVTQIKVLRLLGLLNLKHMWQQDSQLDSVLEVLETLEVRYCHNLIILVPSSASFKHLTTLNVCYCDRLKYLVTSSTAESLKQLKKMTITHCEELTEILENREDDKTTEEIVFRNLWSMSLESLERLSSFCTGNYTFNFPVLCDLRVEKCPKMKTFSEGISNTPRLEKINYSKECWKGDINTTIQQLAGEEKNVQSSEKDSGQPSTQPPV